ncbi:hypothetical protein AAE478_000424 [Parahypoxylon ruwenzoriense]
MSARPSSSKGLGSKSSTSGSLKYAKRISRDDSFINLRAGTSTGFKSYMSTRGQLPTPEASPPSSASARKPSVPTIRMPTPESFNEAHASEIGMALGSPTQSTAKGSLRNQQDSLLLRQASTPNLVSPASGISSLDSYEKPVAKKQPGKWKLFGRFGRKPSDHPNPSLNEQKGSSRLEQPQDMASQSRQESRMERSNTVSTRGAPRHKPIVVRSQTLPYHAESPVQRPNTSSRDKKANDTFGRIPIALDAGPSLAGPLLDVEIPSITMERYSVMFGSVLQSKSQPQPQAQPTLLARRQATIEKLKSIDDAIEKEERRHDLPRRATSPQPTTMSPSLALFPPTPPRLPQNQSSSASPRQRSNTSPAQLRSPLKASFDRSPSNQRHLQNDEPKAHDRGESSIHPKQKGKLTIATLARAREQHPVAREKQFSPDQSSLILESPSEVSSPEFEVVKSEALRPKASYMQEPKWQMITPSQPTPSTATSSSTIASDRRRLPSSPASSTHSHTSQMSDDADDILGNSSNMNPVELSIARQISISRQQRKMLKPLHTGPSASKSRQSPSKSNSNNNNNPVPIIAMAKNEWLAATKSSTPTLIVPEETEAELAQHRKSDRVVLDRS